jgi:ATP-binding cassette, subfamily C, bacterial CydC
MNLAAWTMLLVAVPLVHSGQLNGIYLALIVLAVMASFEAVLPLPAAFQQLGRSLTAARRLFEIVEAQPIVRDTKISSPIPQNYAIEVRNLKFRYNTAEPYILNDINFTIKQGHCIAIVGPSGAGKTTLANLLERFWEYEEGQIQLGGYPLQAYKQQDVHKMISVMAQDTHLFNTTIRENLLIARPQATQEELEEAAKRAQIHEFITSLPQGYNTPIGEQGLRLSGGERQRIAIARAMLKDAPILILDEATANLDALTEQSILQTLYTFMQGRTTLMITHRLVSLDIADEILVLQDGRICEGGTEYELLQMEGLYWNMRQM